MTHWSVCQMVWCTESFEKPWLENVLENGKHFQKTLGEVIAWNHLSIKLLPGRVGRRACDEVTDATLVFWRASCPPPRHHITCAEKRAWGHFSHLHWRRGKIKKEAEPQESRWMAANVPRRHQMQQDSDPSLSRKVHSSRRLWEGQTCQTSSAFGSGKRKVSQRARFWWTELNWSCRPPSACWITSLTFSTTIASCLKEGARSTRCRVPAAMFKHVNNYSLPQQNTRANCKQRGFKGGGHFLHLLHPRGRTPSIGPTRSPNVKKHPC